MQASKIATLPMSAGAEGRLPAIEVKLNGVIAKINPSRGRYSRWFFTPQGKLVAGYYRFLQHIES
ncbi:hypothetical protein Ct9H90mP29_11140 [bacterium]|nr:MAG: hypothetical protein Ct9H90mP29_11140 [bacterium]